MAWWGAGGEARRGAGASRPGRGGNEKSRSRLAGRVARSGEQVTGSGGTGREVGGTGREVQVGASWGRGVLYNGGAKTRRPRAAGASLREAGDEGVSGPGRRSRPAGPASRP